MRKAAQGARPLTFRKNQSIPKERRTFPAAWAELIAYPEVTNTRPPAIVAPVVLIAPPRAGTWLTVVKSWAVLNSQSCFPSAVDTA